MKKHGFTLAEVLITLSIIAISAAILAPLYIQAKPDRYKFKVLNYYNLINDATDRLLSNPAIYKEPKLSSNSAEEFDANSFALTGLDNPDTDGCKYPSLMKQLLNLTDKDSSCSNNEYTGMTSDGTEIKFTYDSTNNNCDILLTFPQPFGSSCESDDHTYDADECRSPYAFKFEVDNSGDVTGADDLTKTFINNAFNIHKRGDYN